MLKKYLTITSLLGVSTEMEFALAYCEQQFTPGQFRVGESIHSDRCRESNGAFKNTLTLTELTQEKLCQCIISNAYAVESAPQKTPEQLDYALRIDQIETFFANTAEEDLAGYQLGEFRNYQDIETTLSLISGCYQALVAFSFYKTLTNTTETFKEKIAALENSFMLKQTQILKLTQEQYLRNLPQIIEENRELTKLSKITPSSIMEVGESEELFLSADPGLGGKDIIFKNKHGFLVLPSAVAATKQALSWRPRNDTNIGKTLPSEAAFEIMKHLQAEKYADSNLTSIYQAAKALEGNA